MTMAEQDYVRRRHNESNLSNTQTRQAKQRSLVLGQAGTVAGRIDHNAGATSREHTLQSTEQVRMGHSFMPSLETSSDTFSRSQLRHPLDRQTWRERSRRDISSKVPRYGLQSQQRQRYSDFEGIVSETAGSAAKERSRRGKWHSRADRSDFPSHGRQRGATLGDTSAQTEKTQKRSKMKFSSSSHHRSDFQSQASAYQRHKQRSLDFFLSQGEKLALGGHRFKGRHAQAGSSESVHGSGKSKDHPSKIPRLNYTELKNLSFSPDSSEVISFIELNLKAFQHSLSTCDKFPRIDQYIETILRILRTICKANTDYQEAANRILAEILSVRCEQFHLQLKGYVCKMTTDKAHETMHLFSLLLRLLPGSSWSVLPVCDLLDSVLLMQDSDLIQQATDLRQIYEDIRLKHRTQAAKRVLVEDEINWDNSLYRTMQLYPTVEEVCIEDSPRLRSGLIKEPYTDWEHYYDVQFRLLREDFVAPLRRGIRECRIAEKGRRNLDIDIYHRVIILEPVFTCDGICYKIQFDISMFRHRRNWEHSKRLIFGSLLCLSPMDDNFQEEVYFAIVANRDPKDLEEGIVQVQFQESVQLIPHCRRTFFIMAESRAYFEASRHILHSLQTAEVDTMPFKRYLVFNQPSPVDKPKYLEEDTAFYDLRWLSCAEDCDSETSLEEEDLPHYDPYRFLGVELRLQSCQSETTKVNILDDYDWPVPEDIELDQSQLDAIKMALRQEIAVIQGPPGTGKTYIGIKIVQTLLQNKDNVGSLPILVLCYTNHALDQFLEGILDHYTQADEPEPKIVRVGRRSQSERIQQLNINNMKTWLPQGLRSDRGILVDSIKDHSQRIPWKSLKMTTQQPINEFIVGPKGVQRLKRVIQPDHWYQLKLATEEEEDDHVLEIWLGLWEEYISDDSCLINNNPQKSNERTTSSDLSEECHASVVEPKMTAEPENSIERQISEDAEPEEPNVLEDVIPVTGEATMEEQARMVDDDAYQPIIVDDGDLNVVEDFELEVLDSGAVHLRNVEREVEHEKQMRNKSKDLTRRRKSGEEVRRLLHKQSTSVIQMDEEEVSNIRDVNSLPLHKRWALLRYWIHQYQKLILQVNESMFDKQTRLCKELKDVQKEIDRYALEKAEIIGMTTTGAAKYQHILHLVKPRIVIVEEAAEVLESHIVSSLNAGTQHLILIGDHKQLRPKPNEYSLAKKHNLDVSLFERLLRNGLPHATLLIQHRMRPEIARLVCPHIYDELHNHPCVEEYGNVKGFSKFPLKPEGEQNLYFFCHEEPEEEDTHLLSHSNEYEAKFVVALCRHLLNQNYKPKQITILTAYTGQLLKVRNKMPRKTFEGVRIVNVDNFQGEENDIIILSLVRSNRQGQVGFLRESNRVCVALSRAKMGLYCFGNFTMLRREVPIWDNILSDMEKRGCVGSVFYIYCQNHPEKMFEVKQPQDFALFAPEGGCKDPCTYRLKCGHVCDRLCHNTDPDHEQVQCKKQCDRLCKRKEHGCSSLCFQDCPPCQVEVTRTFQDCGHTQKILCHQNKCTCLCGKPCPNHQHFCKQVCHVYSPCKPCEVLVEKEMPNCGHTQKLPCCDDPADLCCTQICLKQYPKCGHSVEIECFDTPQQCDCSYPCEKHLGCGHRCRLKCGEPCSISKCTEEVEVELNCGHFMSARCREVWSSKDGRHIPFLQKRSYDFLGFPDLFGKPIRCTNPCSKLLSCGHKCENKCSDPCTEKCLVGVVDTWPCGHISKRQCFQTQNKEFYPCMKPCRNKLLCGHPCKKLCGEKCSETCEQLVIRDCSCGHTHKISCSTPPDQCLCEERCTQVLECGHACSGKCGQCYTTRVHQPCMFQVHVDRFCGHSANVSCFGIMDACKKTCPVGCPHFSYSSDCTIPCTTKSAQSIPCEKPCIWECDHLKCSQPCHMPCDRLRCDKACSKLLPCRHCCPGVCGEPCLKACWQCSRKKFKDKLGMKERVRFEGNLFIQLDCGHIFTMPFLDQQFDKFQKDGLICPIQCPVKNCLKPVRLVGRYFNQIRERFKLIQDIATATVSEEEPLPRKILSNSECMSLVYAIDGASVHRRQVHNFSTPRNQEMLFALNLFLLVQNLVKSLKVPTVKKMARKFSQRIKNILKTTKGSVSDQFIADVEREVLLMCMMEVINLTSPDGHLPSVDLEGFQEAQVVLNKLQTDRSYTFTREECEDYLYPLETFYLDESGQSISDLIPEFSPHPLSTKGEWYKCPAGHVYFHPSGYHDKMSTRHCPDCS